MSIKFECSISPSGAVVTIGNKRPFRAVEKVPFESAGRHLRRASDRAMRALTNDGSATIENGDLHLPHSTIANLPNALAADIGLPVLESSSLALEFDGRIDTPEANIRVRWFDANNRPIPATRQGAFLRIGAEYRRLSQPLFKIAEAVDAFNETVGAALESRVAAWAPLQTILAGTTGREISADGYMKGLTFYQAGAFGLDVTETESGPDFVPVLMSPIKVASVEDNAPTEEVVQGETEERNVELRDQEADALLPPLLQRQFTDRCFSKTAPIRDAYVLGRNTFLFVTPDLKIALDIVRAKRSAPLAERKEFLRNPRTSIGDALRTSGLETSSVFVETSQYSDRVDGLGVWKEIALPPSSCPIAWLPVDSFGSANLNKIVTHANVDEIAAKVEAASAEGRTSIVVGDQTIPIADIASEIDRVQADENAEPTPKTHDDVRPEDHVEKEDVAEPVGLTIKTNIDGVDYEVARRPRKPLLATDFPAVQMNANRPKEHQLQGFAWLVEAWIKGWPGVLLADDMGLGKTYQALAFLTWIRATLDARGRRHPTAAALGPLLVVAPTALLRNWLAESKLHLAGEGLGEAVEAFGAGLKRLKRPKDESWTPEDALDLDLLRSADWILTTYETLADNHRAFARVPYSVVIFDEIQKIKEPGSINTRSAKTLNADFVIGLTGTPIENRIEDLWSIFDRIAPGYLGGLREFSTRYGNEDPEALKQLKALVDEPGEQWPSPMLRRMKDRARDGLPRKESIAYRVNMPPLQAEVYRQIVVKALADADTKRQMLETLHRLRSISLHPRGAVGVDTGNVESVSTWLNESARMRKSVEVLRQLKGLGAKAIIFVEDLAIQRAFAEAMATIFDLNDVPGIINGGVPSDKRQKVVDEFQRSPPGFGLLVLSPKAAGIGLTITAANHVLHLSRWWNPAVEDQCNDRAYRIGQTRDVTVHLPLAVHPEFGDDSFDVKLNELLERKRSLSRNMLCPPESGNEVTELFANIVK